MIESHIFWIGFLFGAFAFSVICMAYGLFVFLDGRKKKFTSGDGTYTIPKDVKHVSIHLSGGAGGGSAGDSYESIMGYSGDHIHKPKPPLMLDL